MSTGEIFDLKIEKVVSGGNGFARLPDGRAVFVSCCYPGETVRARIVQDKKDFARAEMLEILHASEHRIDAFCPYFRRCGGCQWQDLDYDYQCELKKGLFQETFRRAGLADNIPSIIFHESPQIQEFRHRFQFHAKNKEIGFLARNSHDFVAVDDCPIATAPIREFLSNVATDKKRTYPERFHIFANNDGACFIEGVDTNCVVKVLGKDFIFTPDLFFQSHLTLLDTLVKIVLSDFTGKFAVDMYAGVGLFSAFLQDKFEKTFACEATKEVAPYFKINAADVEFFPLISEDFVKLKLPRPVFVVLDPPRQGLSPNVIAYLLKVRPNNIAYVSCDPVTQARDLQKLCEKYIIRETHILDFYPHTSHMETVIHLELKKV